MSLFNLGIPHPDGFREIDVHTFAMVRTLGAPVRVVDVREPAEFQGELGHISGAELVPLATVEKAAALWPRDEELLLVCRSGNRSGRAAAQLARMGFTRVVNLRGGMMAWFALDLSNGARGAEAKEERG